jgi:hypothetical protein
MAQSADNDTRTLRQSDPPAWTALLEVFALLTDLIGEPDKALDDIWRALMSGKVGSLRRRLLSDERVHDVILDRATWHSIRLFDVNDSYGRQTVGMRVVDEADPSILGPRCIFFLNRTDVYAMWPLLLQSEAENSVPGPAKASRRRGTYRGAQRTRARVVLRRIYKDGNYPTEEEVSTPDLWLLFCDEYDRGEEKSRSKLGRPSIETVLREVGRK